MSKSKRSEFIHFLIVGGFSAGVNFISRIGFSELVSYRYAVFFAYIIGMLTAFLLSKHYVFEKSGRSSKDELRDFTIVNIFAVIQVWLISVTLVEYFFPYLSFTFYPEEVAHLIGLGIPVISSYFGHKYFSFKKIN